MGRTRFRILKPMLLTLLLAGSGFFFKVPAAATLQGLQVGAEAPDIRLPSVDGESRSFAELKGEKLTMVVFWSTWSSKSAQVLGDLERLLEKYRDRGLAVIAVNADGQTISEETRSSIRAMAAELKLDFPLLVDQQLTAFRDFGVIALPTTIVLDGERTIRYELSGYPLVGSEEMKSFVVSTIEGKKAVEVQPTKGHHPSKDALRLFNMGKNTLKSRRMAETAEGWFRKAIAADPDFVLPHLSLGKIYNDRGEAALARTEFEQALAKEPDNVVALCEKGMLLVREGKLEEGQALFERTRSVDEGYTPCYYYAGYAYGKQGNLEEAQKMFDAAENINRLDFDIHVFEGRMYEELGRQKEAAEAYRKALEVILSLN